MVRNGYAVATQGNGTLAPEWPACVACAMLARSFKRTGTEQPQRCKQCFSDYCWDGKEDLSDKGEYLPLMKAAAGAKNETRKKKSGAARLEAGSGARTVLGIAVAAVGAFVFL
jgi:lysophospholipase